MTLAERLREITNNSGLSQEQFAKLIDVPVDLHDKFEKGEATPNIAYLYKLKQQNINLMYLFKGNSDNDFISIPYFTFTESPIFGSQIELTNYCSLDKEFFKSLNFSSFENLYLTSAKGDSMSPLINDGDLLIIDTAINDLSSKGIYQVEVNGQIYVKTFTYKSKKNVLVMSSENKAYSCFDLNEYDLVFPIGKVVGSLSVRSFS